jgi:hypothetical protein
MSDRSPVGRPTAGCSGRFSLGKQTKTVMMPDDREEKLRFAYEGVTTEERNY